MTDYYPLIGKAVAGLEKNTGEARRALYERARTALVAQLRNMDPPLTETEITRERLGLEEAIRKVEAEAARRLRMETRAASPSSTKPADGAPEARPREPFSTAKSAANPPAEARQDTAPQAVPPRTDTAAAPRQDGWPSTRDPAASPRQDGATSSRQEVVRGRQDPAMSSPAAATDKLGDDQPPDDASPNAPPGPPPRSGRHRVFGDRPPLTEEGLRGFRDVVAEAESLGEKTAQATRSARQAYAAVPANIPELDRVEPRLDTE